MAVRAIPDLAPASPAQTLPTPAGAMRPAPSVAGDAGSGLAAQDMGQNGGRAARVVYMPVVEYGPGAAFPGVIGRTADESTPAWPAPVRAHEGAPNVVFIVLDDTGFGQLGCYGSPIQTPSFDALAADGLRYSNMHTTALCSPSRSCIRRKGASAWPTIWSML